MAHLAPQASPARIDCETKSKAPPFGLSRRLCAVGFAVTLTIFAICLYFAWRHFHDSAIERRLTGTWVSDFAREDGTVATFVWKFSPDGTMRHYLKGESPAESGSIDDYMWWKISDGLLVVTYDRQFYHDASLKWKANFAIRYAWEFATGKNHPLARHDRCVICESGGDSIELALRPNENPLDSWFGSGTTVLNRTSDGIAIKE